MCYKRCVSSRGSQGKTLEGKRFFYPERSQKVIDINGLPLDKVEVLPDGSLKIGAVVRNSDLAHHAAVVRDYPVLSQALLSGASAQLSAWRRRDRLGRGCGSDCVRRLSCLWSPYLKVTGED